MFSPTYRHHFKDNLKVALPVCMSQLGHVMVGVIDSVMVGGLGKTSLAASALSNSIFSLPLLFGIGVSYGMTPSVAAANGEHNFIKAGFIFKHGLIINIITGILLFVLFHTFSFLIHYLNQPEEVVKLTIPYFRIFIFSLIPLMIFQSFRQFAEGLSLTKQAMFISVGGNIYNIISNYIFIYGKFGFPALGLNGAAWSTFVARVLMAISMGLFIFFSPRVKPYIKNFNLKAFSKDTFMRILKIGIPSAIQFLFEVTAFSMATVMMGWIGTDEIAAHQIAISMASLTYMFATGFSAGAVVRVGNFFGMKNKAQLRIAGFSSFILVAIFMAICALTFIFGNKILPSIYISDPSVINIASSLMIIGAFFQISDGIQVVGLGTLRGISDVKIPTVITFVAYWVLGLPIGYLLANFFNMGAEGIWLGLLIGLSVSAVLLFMRFNYKSKTLFNFNK